VRSLIPILLSALLAGSCAAPNKGRPEDSPREETEGTSVDWSARLQRLPSSEELQRLTVLCGRWTVALEDLSSGPEPLEVARGRAQIEAVLGGRFLAWETELTLQGHTVRAEGRLGFDEANDVFQLLWMSELAPGMRIARGRGDARRGGLVLEISERDPQSGALLRARSVLKVDGEDRFSLTQLGLDPRSSEWVATQRTSYVRLPESAPAQVPAS
jgi:hypothetical protein